MKDYKKEYKKIKQEFEDYKFANGLTKEEKVDWLHKYFGFKVDKYGGMLWKLSHEELDVILKKVRGK